MNDMIMTHQHETNVGKKRINDGLMKWERYRLKDLEAYRKRKREYARTPEERAKRVAYMRVWREKNRARHNELCRQSHERNRHKHVEKVKDYWLIKKYGITLTEKVAMITKQGGRCAICSKVFSSERCTHLDHCHVTKAIRGVLCHVCNTKLGWWETNKSKIEEYLERTTTARTYAGQKQTRPWLRP